MKVVILASSISDKFAAAMLLRLKEQGNDVSIIVRRYSFKKIREVITKHGLKRTFIKVWNEFILKKTCGNNDHDSRILNDYCKRLGYNPYITLREVIKDGNITCKFVRNITDDKSISYLRTIHPDIIIPLGIGIIRENLLDIPRKGTLNAHMGLLPKYRGMNVLEWSLFNNDPIGITVHFMDTGIDTGDILLKKNVPINTVDTIESLRAKSIPISVEGFFEVIKKLGKSDIQRRKQSDEEGKQYFVMHKRLRNFVEKQLLFIIKG